ncbi:MAG: hypothetical protein NUK65_00915 [Firmicutes bacterium]|nr:hypothetical protein [Bacillota bacterium]
MEITIAKVLLAAVTTTTDHRIAGLPVFYAETEDEMAKMATILSRILEAVAHDMENGVYIIVKH